MLPDINLDNESFDDILENAKNSIVSCYPGWTDFNYHDPGVTMLEMFAWLKEIQQYYLNKIGPANISKYLKLLGIQRRTKCPSSTEVSVDHSSDIVAARGTRLYAGDICFEAESRTYISSSRMICCICKGAEGQRVIDHSELSFGGNLRIFPFSDEYGSEFYIGFDKPLAAGREHHLYIDINDQGPVRRNPITDPGSFIPLVDITAEYYSKEGWTSLELEDNTFGFLTSGMMKLCPGSQHERTKAGDREAYYIRFRFTGGEYDVLPMIKNMSFNLLPVIQRKTMVEYLDLPAEKETTIFTYAAATGSTKIYLKDENGLFSEAQMFEKLINEDTGEVTIRIPDIKAAAGIRVVNTDPSFSDRAGIGSGTGLPFQEYDLETEFLEYDSFCLMTELPASEGKLVEWKKVSDFSTAKAGDFVYVLDTAAGKIRFGDCIRGMAPEGRIYIAGCSYTLGANGNVSVGKIDHMEYMGEDEIRITNNRRSEGGLDEETVENCCFRAYRMMQTTETLVTDEDHENYIMGVQGLKLETCHMLEAKKTGDRKNSPFRLVVVKPYSPGGKGVPGERYCKNILAALEKRRMLGTGFRIIRPEYAAVRVCGDITIDRSVPGAREEIERVIGSYFDECKNKFGTKLIYSKLYEMIDRLSFVVSLNTLTLETHGSGAQRTREGDLILSSNVMAYLTGTDLMISTDR